MINEWKGQTSDIKIKGLLKKYNNSNKIITNSNIINKGKIHFKEKFDIPKPYKSILKIFKDQNLNKNEKIYKKKIIEINYKDKFRKERKHYKNLNFTSNYKEYYNKIKIEPKPSNHYELLMKTKRRILPKIKENKNLLNPNCIYSNNFYEQGGLIIGSTIQKRKPKINMAFEELKETFKKYNFMDKNYKQIQKEEIYNNNIKETFELEKWEMEKFGKIKGDKSFENEEIIEKSKNNKKKK